MLKTRKHRSRKNKSRKFRKIRKQRGGLIEDYQRVFDIEFDDKWVLTGSEAVRIYGALLKLPAPAANDVDILYVSRKDFRENGFSGFFRRQSEPMRSMTFLNAQTGQSFDVNVQASCKYYIVPYNGRMYRLLEPRTLLGGYQSEFNTRGEKQAANRFKMSVLDSVVRALDAGTLVLQGPYKMTPESDGTEPVQPVTQRTGIRNLVMPPALVFSNEE